MEQGAGEGVAVRAQDGGLIRNHTRGRGSQPGNVEPPPPLQLVGNVAKRAAEPIGAPDHVRRVASQNGLDHGRRGRRRVAIQIPGVRQGSHAGRGRAAMAGSGRPCIARLTHRPVPVAHTGAVGPSVGGRGTLDVRAWGHDLWLPPPVPGGASTGEVDEVTGIVGTRVEHTAPVGAGHAVVLRSAHRDHVLGRAWRPHGRCSGAGVARREEDGKRLQPVGGVSIRIANDAVVLLALDVVGAGRVRSPAIGGEERATGASGSSHGGEGGAPDVKVPGIVEDTRRPQVRTGRDSQPIEIGVRIQGAGLVGIRRHTADDGKVDGAVTTDVVSAR